jgi:hypothetical protein
MDVFGKPRYARALLDSASQSHFVTKQLADIMDIKRNSVKHIVYGVNGIATNIKHKTTTSVASRITSYQKIIDFLVVDKITGDLPIESINTELWNIPKEIILADPSFNSSAKIDILLGIEVFLDSLRQGRIQLGHNYPAIQETAFGYIIGGNYPSIENSTLCATFSHAHATTNEDLSHQLKTFWEIENCHRIPALSQEQNQCETIFASTYSRDSTGRFTVKLPIKSLDINRLGESKSIAIRRFLHNERRLNCNVELKCQYNDFMFTNLFFASSLCFEIRQFNDKIESSV